MGPQHTQTDYGVVFNAPYAEKEYRSGRFEGTIVHQYINDYDDKPFFVAAEGGWWGRFDGSKRSRRADPHWYDQTGASFAQGNFYRFNKDLEHFVVGAPNADRLRGAVYICHDCFGTKSQNNGRTLSASRPQHGERLGAAVAAVDINGDGFDDVVAGAPLHSSKVK